MVSRDPFDVLSAYHGADPTKHGGRTVDAAPQPRPAAFRLAPGHIAAIAATPTLCDAWIVCSRHMCLSTPEFTEFFRVAEALGAATIAALRAASSPWLRLPAQTCTMLTGETEHVFDYPDGVAWQRNCSERDGQVRSSR